MEVKYCLSCNFVIILKNIKSITAQNLSHVSCKLLCKLHGFSCNFLIDIIDICIVLFRKKQTGTDRMESAEFESAFPAEGVSQCEAAAEGAKKYPADMLIDEVIEEVFS